MQFNHLQDLQNLENLASKVDAVVSLLWTKVLPLNFSFLTLSDAEAMSEFNHLQESALHVHLLLHLQLAPQFLLNSIYQVTVWSFMMGGDDGNANDCLNANVALME